MVDKIQSENFSKRSTREEYPVESYLHELIVEIASELFIDLWREVLVELEIKGLELEEEVLRKYYKKNLEVLCLGNNINFLAQLHKLEDGIEFWEGEAKKDRQLRVFFNKLGEFDDKEIIKANNTFEGILKNEKSSLFSSYINESLSSNTFSELETFCLRFTYLKELRSVIDTQKSTLKTISERKGKGFKSDNNKVIVGYSCRMGSGQIRTLYDCLIENNYIEEGTKLKVFEEIFNPSPLPDGLRIKWLKTHRLLAYFVWHMFSEVDPNSYWNIAENVFINKTNNFIKNLSQEFQNNPSPKGFEQLEEFIKQLKGL